MCEEVQWGRARIPFTCEFSDRKTLAISVHPDLRVTVKAPLNTPIQKIHEKVLKRGPWIRRQWREFELYLPKQPPRRYVNGETHRYLGRQYRLRAERGEEDSVKYLRGRIWVATRTEPEPDRVKELLDSWYRGKAKLIFHERFNECYKNASREGVHEPTLQIQKMTTRWGSCSEKGRILLNIDLVKAPKDCIDYVITHELCHLKEGHHGPRFWRLMAKLMPDYEKRRQRLNHFADV